MQSKVIVDLVFFLAVLLFVIIGAVRGFSKSLKGFLLTFPILLITILLCSWLLPIMQVSHLGYSISSSIEKSIDKKKNPAMDVSIYKDAESGNFYAIMPPSVSNDQTPYELDNFPDAGLKLKLSLILPLAKKNATDKAKAVKTLFAEEITLHVLNIILHVFCVAIVTAIFIILRLATRNWHKSDVVAEAVLDRVFGLILSAALIICFFLFVLSAMRFFADGSDVAKAVKESAVVGKLYAANPVGQVFDKQTFGVLGLLRKMFKAAPSATQVLFFV